MAEKVDEIHSAVTGDLCDKIQDVHTIVLALAGTSPRLNPRDSRASDLVPLWDSPLLEPLPDSLRNSYYSRVSGTPQSQQRSPDIAPLEGGGGGYYPRRRRSSRRESDTSTAPSLSETSSSVDWRSSSGGTAFSTMTAGTRTTAMSPGSPGPSSRRQSTTPWRIEEAADEGESERQHPTSPLSPPQSPPQYHRQQRQEQQQQCRADSRLSCTSSILPSPAIPPDPDPEVGLRRLSLGPSATAKDVEKMSLERSMTTESQQDAFEKEAFRDSAILCEL